MEIKRKIGGLYKEMLTKEQQNIIENSIWVVNTALKKQGLQTDDDLRQSAILYMCKCLERFDPSKDIKWTTFAYKSVFLFIKRTHGKEMKKKAYIINDDILDLNLPLESTEGFNDNKYTIDVIKGFCTPKERQIIDLKLKGYGIAEIGVILKCSSSNINCCMQSIKEKVRDMGI